MYKLIDCGVTRNIAKLEPKMWICFVAWSAEDDYAYEMKRLRREFPTRSLARDYTLRVMRAWDRLHGEKDDG
jgi:hypothetical protein